jgi:hypothetical protein
MVGSEIFECEVCDYRTSRHSQYMRHLATTKHQKSTDYVPLSTKVNQKISQFSCECGREYKERSGLWRHKKVCQTMVPPEPPKKSSAAYELSENVIIMLINDNKELRKLFIEQAKENDELKSMMMEVMKNGTNNTNSNNTNCNNKAFNLNVFLNETCKNAMNITEFVESIKVQLKDLETFGEVGYVEGLSNIITTNLKEMDVTERPVHCTDKKRETIYIKDDNKWEKEDDNKTKLRKAIKRIASKNYKLLPAYREKYPGCQYAASKYSDKYNKMMVEVMGGAGDNDIEKEDKIIHNISKNVIVDK